MTNCRPSLRDLRASKTSTVRQNVDGSIRQCVTTPFQQPNKSAPLQEGLAAGESEGLRLRIDKFYRGFDFVQQPAIIDVARRLPLSDEEKKAREARKLGNTWLNK
jgi:hypothetical protein